jgi:hypothetical protein
MKKRLKRLIRWSSLLPAIFFFEAILKIFHYEEFFKFIGHTLSDYGVLNFLLSPSGLILISTAWLTVLIIGPDIWKRLPQHTFKGSPHLRTWIDESERHEILYDRLLKCKPEENVRFISFTGKSVLLPEETAGKRLKDYPFPRAVNLGTTFQGLLLNPQSDEAKFRSFIETPDTPEEERLLQRHSREVAKLPTKYDQAGIKESVARERVQLKYISLGLQFSLWLFDDVALIEPYHLGRREAIGNLCEFAQMIIPSSDINYKLLENHFQNMWNHTTARLVWH